MNLFHFCHEVGKKKTHRARCYPIKINPMLKHGVDFFHVIREILAKAEGLVRNSYHDIKVVAIQEDSQLRISNYELRDILSSHFQLSIIEDGVFASFRIT